MSILVGLRQVLAHIATSKVCAIIEPVVIMSHLHAICLCNRGDTGLYERHCIYPRIVSADTGSCGEGDVAV